MIEKSFLGMNQEQLVQATEELEIVADVMMVATAFTFFWVIVFVLSVAYVRGSEND